MGSHWCKRHQRVEMSKRECGHPIAPLVARPPTTAVHWCPGCAAHLAALS